MKFYVEVEKIRDAINKILSVVDKRNTRPILTYTLLEVKNNKLNLIATDLEVSAKFIIDTTVEEEGVFCVNAKNLFDILKELPNDKLLIELTNNTLNLECNDIEYSLLVCGSDEYPAISFEKNENNFSLSHTQVLEIINRTFYAISNDETRLFLNGIYLQDVDSRLRAVATDGHRLALIETDFNQESIDQLLNGIIIPKKGVHELRKIAEHNPEVMINFSIDELFMYVNVGEEYFLSIRLISREYPKYQAVIPNKTVFTMTVDRTLFLDAVKRIKIMSNEKSNGIKVNLTNHEMIITANHPSLGHATEKINIDFDSDQFEIGLNAKYLIDILTHLEDGDITLEFNNELAPVLIKSNDVPDYLGILMPLRI